MSTSVLRYDRCKIRAARTDEGYLIDTPVVGRAGIQLYKNPDGTIRRELRPPEEVFAADSLATFSGKPITDEHPDEPVTAKNAKHLAIGMIQSAGKQDGDSVTAPIVIYDAEAVDKIIHGKKRELSLGYKVDLDETPGVWNGQEYDAVQRKIRINHLAIVSRGRAGNARLNLDRHDAISLNFDEDNTMSTENLGRLRLDNGIEYPAVQEVIHGFETLRNDKAELDVRVDELHKQIDIIAAERDTLKAEVEKIEQIKKDAAEQAKTEMKARLALEKVAEGFKVDCTGKTDREVKELVIKATRTDADLAGKSEAYIDAAFDLASEMKADDAMAKQREAGAGRQDVNKTGAGNSYANFMANLGKKENA